MNKIEAAADIISQSEKLVVFTGAGISTESGIPDFRSPGGVWSKFDPNEYTYQKCLASEENRVKAWDNAANPIRPTPVSAQFMARIGVPNPGRRLNIKNCRNSPGNARRLSFSKPP